MKKQQVKEEEPLGFGDRVLSYERIPTRVPKAHIGCVVFVGTRKTPLLKGQPPLHLASRKGRFGGPKVDRKESWTHDWSKRSSYSSVLQFV
jgi:hypothetical protein